MLKITRRCRNKGNFVDGFLLRNLSSNGIIVAKGRWNNCQNMKKKCFLIPNASHIFSIVGIVGMLSFETIFPNAVCDIPVN